MGVNVRAALLAKLTRRQIEIAAAYLDGVTQGEIADLHDISQATVSRELNVVRFVAKLFNAALPEPQRVRAADECQLSEELYRSL
jgi:FixJ family two-component response regulator